MKCPRLWRISSPSKIQSISIQIEHLKTKIIFLHEDNILMTILKAKELEFIWTLRWMIILLHYKTLQLSKRTLNLLVIVVSVDKEALHIKIEGQVVFQLWIQLSSCRYLVQNRNKGSSSSMKMRTSSQEKI